MLAEDAKGKTKRNARRRRQEERRRFAKVRRAEAHFSRQLRKIAEAVGDIVDKLAPNGVVSNLPAITTALEGYAERIEPWARAVARRSVEEVARMDVAAWADLSRQIGRGLVREIRQAPVGKVMLEEMRDRVELITSLPREAGLRAHRLVVSQMTGGRRAAETAKEIARTGEVTGSRAMLIARTETTSCATALVKARAKHVGSKGYIWRTAGDADVRPLHKALEGVFVPWDDPPVAGENGERAHAGAIYNCRCWPEPVLPDVIFPEGEDEPEGEPLAI